MKINVAETRKHIGQKQAFDFTVSTEKLSIDDRSPFSHEPIRVTGEVVNDGGFLEVKGIIHLTGHFQCDRCTGDFVSPVDTPFRELFREKGSGVPNGQKDVAWYADDEIDLSELIRENVLLAEPLKTVCSDSCRGLCPVCGKNLNVSECDCQKDQIDPRLAVFKQLLDKK